VRNYAVNAALLRGLSEPRLGRYMADSNQILDSALSLYERNMRIAEAFHRPLQALEVCLRNHMHERLTAAYGANWYRTTNAPFDKETTDKLDKAMDDVERAGHPVTPGAVVAELNFGFWVLLLSKRYGRILWPPVLSPIFHEGGKRMGLRKVHNRMNELRNFRNRLAHHEPIYHLNPAQAHKDIIEAIAWICPATAAWAWEHSRVPHVLSNPWP